MSAKNVPTTIVESTATDLHASQDLGSALSAILTSQPGTHLATLQHIVTKIQGYLDPATVTMTSTNIPDAVGKLSACLHELTDSTTKVFALIERQKELIAESEKILSDDSIGAPVAQMNTHLRSLNNELQSCCHQIILAHESTDLISQKIRKVVALIQDVDPTLRDLLRQLNARIPAMSNDASNPADSDLDQAAADAILKDLGIST